MTVSSADPHAGMRCVQRASLFGCAYVPTGDGGSGVAVLVTALGWALARTRGRRRRRA
jgi:hypothetical protein